MTYKTRLKISTVLGLAGVLGLSLIFYNYLPDKANELVRRETEIQMENVSNLIPDDITSMALEQKRILKLISKDDRVIALAERAVEEEPDYSRDVKLARDLTVDYKLDNLLIMDNTGRKRSLHPEAARIGRKDLNLLENIRLASSRMLF